MLLLQDARTKASNSGEQCVELRVKFTRLFHPMVAFVQHSADELDACNTQNSVSKFEKVRSDNPFSRTYFIKEQLVAAMLMLMLVQCDCKNKDSSGS